MASCVGSSQAHVCSRPFNYLERAIDVLNATCVAEAFLGQDQMAHIVRVRKYYLSVSFKTFELFVIVWTTIVHMHLIFWLLLIV